MASAALGTIAWPRAPPPRLRWPASASSARIAALGLRVAALAEVRVAHVAAGVEQVLGRPVLVAVGVPGRVVVVLRHRVAQPVRADRRGDVAGVVLERELRRVHADDRQAVGPVLRVEALEERQRAQAVDAGVGPEVHQHDAPAQRGQAERAAAGRVEPSLRAGEVRRGAEVGQLRRRGGGARRRRRSAGFELGAAAQLGEAPVDRVGILERGRRRDVGEMVRQRLLEAHVHHRQHQHRGQDHHTAERSLQAGAAAGRSARGRPGAARPTQAPAARRPSRCRRPARSPPARPTSPATRSRRSRRRGSARRTARTRTRTPRRRRCPTRSRCPSSAARTAPAATAAPRVARRRPAPAATRRSPAARGSRACAGSRRRARPRARPTRRRRR